LAFELAHLESELGPKIQEVKHGGVNCVDLPSPIVDFHDSFAPPLETRAKKKAANSRGVAAGSSKLGAACYVIGFAARVSPARFSLAEKRYVKAKYG
jgi:hypothetical protein